MPPSVPIQETNPSGWRAHDSVSVPKSLVSGATGALAKGNAPFVVGTNKKECPMHGHIEATGGNGTGQDINNKPTEPEAGDSSSTGDVAPPSTHQTNIDWSGNTGNVPDPDKSIPETDDMIRTRNVTLRRQRRKSQVSPEAE